MRGEGEGKGLESEPNNHVNWHTGMSAEFGGKVANRRRKKRSRHLSLGKISVGGGKKTLKRKRKNSLKGKRRE